MIIVGIDPSLTGTGIARIDTEDRLVAAMTTVTSTGKRDDTWVTRTQRLEDLAHRISKHCLIADDLSGWPVNPDLVVLEAPTLSQGRQGGHLDRHGLWWLILARLTAWECPYAVVTASSRAKYATGKGNAPKDEVLLAVARRYPHVAVTNSNEADALILAAMGARHLGQPIEDSLPIAQRDAMERVAWPERSAA